MLRRVWAPLRPVVPLAGLVLAAVLAVAFVALILKWAPEWLAKEGLSRKDEAEEIGRVRTALLATLAGVIAIVGAVFTGLSYRLNQAGQITERFTRAIDQLGSAEIDVRLGGIYALERIARDSKDDHPQVIEVLTAYVREHAPWPPKSSSVAAAQSGSELLTGLTEAIRSLERVAKGIEAQGATGGTELAASEGERAAGDGEPLLLPTDVQAAMSVLGRRRVSQDRRGAQLALALTGLRGITLVGDEAHLERADLIEAHLEKAILAGAHLEGAFLGGAHLEGADLNDAHLERADLGRAHLDGARFYEAHLEGALLMGAHLERALLTGAHLEEADLGGAHLQEAVLNAAHLEQARLNSAHLEDAILAGAHLEGATLVWAHFEGANLRIAHLERAFLGGAHLEGADLGEAHLEGALYDATTVWPELGFDAEGQGARRIDVHPRA